MQQHFDIISRELAIIRSYKEQLEDSIKRELSYNGFQFKRHYSTSFQIRFKGVVYLEVTYYRLCETHGGQKDEDGDLIDVFPFRVAFDDACNSCNSYQKKEIKSMTAQEAVNIIRQQIMKHVAVDKRQKTEYDIDQFCADMTTSIEAIVSYSEFTEKFHKMRSMMHL